MLMCLGFEVVQNAANFTSAKNTMLCYDHLPDILLVSASKTALTRGDWPLKACRAIRHQDGNSQEIL